MDKIYRSARGISRMTITGAAPDLLLNRLSDKKIAFWEPVRINDFSVCFCVFRRDVEAVTVLVEGSSCDVSDRCDIGIAERVDDLLRRPVLLLGTMACILMILICQNHLLFFQVSGTQNVSPQKVIRILDELGIGVGVLGPEVKPKWIKDHVLNIVPQFQWITVTQNGCKAQIVVREREQAPERLNPRGYANVISSRDAIITEQSVLMGQPLRKVGDTVLKGEMLVSGIVDLEKIFSVVYAQAEIYGRTWHRKEVMIPEDHFEKIDLGTQSNCYWLEIGKRRIKIFGNSRISHADHDKIIKRSRLTLPGGVVLPVSLITEVSTDYEKSIGKLSAEEALSLAKSYASDKVSGEMHAGRILKEKSDIVRETGRYHYSTVMECQEMIAVTVEGKWNEEDLKND